MRTVMELPGATLPMPMKAPPPLKVEADWLPKPVEGVGVGLGVVELGSVPVGVGLLGEVLELGLPGDGVGLPLP